MMLVYLIRNSYIEKYVRICQQEQGGKDFGTCKGDPRKMKV